MSYTTEHRSGTRGGALRVEFWKNGEGVAAHFGDAASTMRTLWFEGVDAAALRLEVYLTEMLIPEKQSRDVWLDALNEYL